MTPPKFVEWTASSNTTSPLTTLTYNKPVQVGTLLIAVLRWNASGTITPPTGWTLLESITSQVVKFFIFYMVATTTTNVFTFTASSTSGYPSASGFQISNADQNNPFNSHSLASNVPSTSYTSPSITPTQIGLLPISFIDTGDDSMALTSVTPASWVNQTMVSSGAPYSFVGALSSDTTTAQAVSVTFLTSTGYSSAAWTAFIMYDTLSNSGSLTTSRALVNMIVDVQDETLSQVQTIALTSSLDDSQNPGPNVKPPTYGQ